MTSREAARIRTLVNCRRAKNEAYYAGFAQRIKLRKVFWQIADECRAIK